MHHQDLAFVFATVFVVAYYSCDLFNEKQFGNLMTSFRGIIRFSWHNYKQGKQGSLSFNAWMNRVFWKVQTRKKSPRRFFLSRNSGFNLFTLFYMRVFFVIRNLRRKKIRSMVLIAVTKGCPIVWSDLRMLCHCG